MSNVSQPQNHTAALAAQRAERVGRALVGVCSVGQCPCAAVRLLGWAMPLCRRATVRWGLAPVPPCGCSFVGKDPCAWDGAHSALCNVLKNNSHLKSNEIREI